MHGKVSEEGKVGVKGRDILPRQPSCSLWTRASPPAPPTGATEETHVEERPPVRVPGRKEEEEGGGCPSEASRSGTEEGPQSKNK